MYRTIATLLQWWPLTSFSFQIFFIQSFFLSFNFSAGVRTGGIVIGKGEGGESLTLGPKDPVSPQGASIKKCGKVGLFLRDQLLHSQILLQLTVGGGGGA
jgi:hypothetical protein